MAYWSKEEIKSPIKSPILDKFNSIHSPKMSLKSPSKTSKNNKISPKIKQAIQFVDTYNSNTSA